MVGAGVLIVLWAEWILVWIESCRRARSSWRWWTVGIWGPINIYDDGTPPLIPGTENLVSVAAPRGQGLAFAYDG